MTSRKAKLEKLAVIFNRIRTLGQEGDSDKIAATMDNTNASLRSTGMAMRTLDPKGVVTGLEEVRDRADELEMALKPLTQIPDLLRDVVNITESLYISKPDD